MQPPRLIPRILRVNHAGEHGAVAIYSAQLAHARRAHPDLVPWLEEHKQCRRAFARQARGAHNEHMPFLDPSAHKVDLRAALDAQGWDVEVMESAVEAWWMNELWRIRSRWRPVGATLFVSFVGDQSDERSPPQRVGEVGVGREPVSDIHARNVARFPLAPDWPTQLANIVAHAAKLRDKSA